MRPLLLLFFVKSSFIEKRVQIFVFLSQILRVLCVEIFSRFGLIDKETNAIITVLHTYFIIISSIFCYVIAHYYFLLEVV